MGALILLIVVAYAMWAIIAFAGHSRRSVSNTRDEYEQRKLRRNIDAGRVEVCERCDRRPAVITITYDDESVDEVCERCATREGVI